MSAAPAAVDMLGNALAPGDTIAYAVTIGRSACMGIYEVLEIKSREAWHRGSFQPVATLRARQIAVSYSYLNGKDVTLGMADRRALKIKRPAHIPADRRDKCPW